MASAASAMDGAIGVDHVWLRRLQRALDETKCPASLDDALRPLMAHFPDEIDAGDLQAAVDGQRELWRLRLYSATGGFQLPPSYRLDWAVAIYVYTLSDPKVFRVVNREMFNPERRKNGGVSAGLRACLPYIRFLTAALKALPARYVFRGQVRRGVKHVFPTIADHDPAGHFAIGAFVMWYEFKSTSRNPQVMAREHFCGVAAGPRTTFIVDVVCGYDISPFSFFQGAESEYEVLMLPMSLFEVVYVAKNILDAAETVVLERSGFPDVVHLRQVVASAAGVPTPAATASPAAASPAAASSAGGTVAITIEARGTCAMCGTPVLSHHARAKDPHGAYVHMTCVEASEARKAQASATDSCVSAGVGILFVEEEDPSGFVRVTVKALIEGGSAERTGMVRAGDMVVRVGNQDVIGKPLSVLRTMIPGPIGSYCRLGFLRGGVALNSNAVQVSQHVLRV